MQKVSKQSLAMIALSILLAISIALTFTFAALSATNKATGTITFTGNASLLINNSTENYSFTVTFDANGKATTDSTLSGIAVSLGSGSTSTKVKAAMTFVEPDGAKDILKKYIYVDGTETKVYEKTTTGLVTAGSEAFKLSDVVKFADISTSSADFATLTSTSGTYQVVITFTCVD